MPDQPGFFDDPTPPKRTQPSATAFDRALGGAGRRGATIADVHPLAFVAVCVEAGITHPALVPVVTHRKTGRRRFDAAGLRRLANLILTGVASEHPEVTPDRWRAAGDRAAAWWHETRSEDRSHA